MLCVRLYFSPTQLDETIRVYKYDTANGWFEYTGYVEFSDDYTFITIELVDGGYGDADEVVNLFIVDPLGISVSAAADENVDDEEAGDREGSEAQEEDSAVSSGGGGGGCFIGEVLGTRI